MKELIENIDLLETEIDQLLFNVVDDGGITPERQERLDILQSELRQKKDKVVAICRKAVS